MKIIIPGDPIPQKRHRHVRQGLHIRTYDPCAEIKKEIAKQYRHLTPLNGAYRMILTLEMPIPPSTPKNLLNSILWGLVYHTKKPDNSNCLKLYEDAFNEILYPDDACIVYSSQKKLYSLQPKTIIEVTPLPEVTLNEQSQEIFKLISPKQIEEMCHLALDVMDCQNHAQTAQIQPESEPEKIEQAADAYYSALDRLARSIYDLAEKYSSTLSRIRKSTSYDA